ncbi:MAG: hypothetical protein HFG27_08695 [Provencibacterium sp.]|nr:hypothetical protein [Provencibacterium sp.]
MELRVNKFDKQEKYLVKTEKAAASGCLQSAGQIKERCKLFVRFAEGSAAKCKHFAADPLCL